MKKNILFFLLVAGCMWGLEVDKEELSKNAARIDFINYTGPYTRPQGRDDLRVIGETLALLRQTNREVWYPDMKYSIIRAVDVGETNGFDADILSFHTNSRIFHVKYIQALLSFYLAKTFSYDEVENDAIAWFIVYYNATHRGDMDFFRGRYKKRVLEFLDRTKVGLARRYTEWPGKTQIVIPLSENPLNKTLRLDVLALGEQKTIEVARQQPDKAIEQRETLIEVEKKQIAQDELAIQKTKEEIAQEKKEIAQKKEEVQTKETQLQQQAKALAEEKKKVEQLPPGPEKEKAKQEVARKEETLQQEKKQLEQEKKAVEEKQATVATKEQQVKQAEKQVAEGKKQVAEQEKKLAEDKTTQTNASPQQLNQQLEKKAQELAEKETNLMKQEQTLREGLPSDIKGGKLYYLKINGYYTDGHYSNEMLLIDPVKRTLLLSSPYKSIGGHKFDFSSEGIVVIGFEPLPGEGTRATRSDNRSVIVGYEGPRPENYVLVMLNETNLGVRYKGTDTIFWRSFVEVRGESIYVIVSEKNAYYLARFDLLFKKQAQSKEPIDPNTFISFFGDEVFVNSTKREILVLDKETLEVREVIRP